MRLNLLLCLLFWSPLAFSQVVPTSVAEGNGYKILRLPDAQHKALFETSKKNSQLNQTQKSSPAASTTHEVTQITSLRGLQSRNLPSWFQQDILEDLGYSDWSTVPASALDTEIGPYAADNDSIAEIDRAYTTDTGTVKPLGFFSKKVEDKVFKVSKTFKQTKRNDVKSVEDGTQFTGNFELTGTGTVAAELSVNIHSRVGIPYSAHLNHALVNFDAEVIGIVGLGGSITKKYSGNLIGPLHFDLFRDYQTYPYFIFEFGLETKLAIDYGIKLEAEANATLGARYKATGKLGLSYRCTSGDCVKTRSENSTNVETQEQPSASLAIKASAVPYFDTNVTLTAGMYGNILELAEGKLGVVSSLPITFNFYAGNTCSDATGDGINEQVRASLLDGNFEIYAYLEAKVIGLRKGFYAIDLSILTDKATTSSLILHPGKTGKVYRRNLFMADFVSGGSNVVQPVLRFANSSGLTSTLTLAPRSCYPYSNAQRYEINFGDGTSFVVGTQKQVSHTWSQAGTYNVTVRTLGDDVGRSFDSPSVSIPIKLGNATSPTPSGKLLTAFTGTGRCLDAANDGSGQLRMKDCSSAGQKWFTSQIAAGVYYLMPDLPSAACLDVVNDALLNKVKTAACGNYSGQFWILTDAGQGYYKLTNQFTGPQKCLDIINDGLNDKLNLSSCTNASGQLWRFL